MRFSYISLNLLLYENIIKYIIELLCLISNQESINSIKIFYDMLSTLKQFHDNS